jgi:hypothetical protein
LLWSGFFTVRVSFVGVRVCPSGPPSAVDILYATDQGAVTSADVAVKSIGGGRRM